MYQRNLYVLAINLAQKAGLDASQQNVILRKFGDYLYSKQDYDTAMQQYLKAIDNTEPSQVIRKVPPFTTPFPSSTDHAYSSWTHNESTI